MSGYNPFFEPATSTTPLVDIVIRDAWQVRKGLSHGTVDRYAAIYRAGTPMEPVRLARIADGLVLVDGAHRIAALRSLGCPTVEAVIEPMKEHAAQWAAASANLEHGLPLKKKELRAVFRQYVATGQHRKGRSGVKSIREIVADIPGVSFGTIRNWLMKDYPQMYSKSYSGSNGELHSHGGLEDIKRPTQQALDMQALDEHLRQVEAIASLYKSAAIRQAIAKRMAATQASILT